MAYRVGLYTLGCKVSQYETEAVAEAFVGAGFELCSFKDVCDVYVVNTCTVTAESDRKSRQIIRRANRTNPEALIMVMGCYSERSASEVLGLRGVACVIGTEGKMRLPEKALALLAERQSLGSVFPIASVLPLENAVFEPMTVKSAPRTRAYVKIEDGCECRCTYCAISLARGNVRSKNAEDILSEIQGLCDGGTREVVLTGIETSSYGADFSSYGLIELLERIEKESSVSRIRLGSISPEWLKMDVIDRLSALSKLTPHFHLSVQSGSSAVLRNMKRRYNKEMALSSVLALREQIPTVEFTADMMVGFPGETQADFEETMDFARQAAFLDMHVFAYSPRKGTPAASFEGQIDEETKKERSARLSALGKELTRQRQQNRISKAEPLKVLFETEKGGLWRGHSDEFFEVEAFSQENLHGALCSVLPLSVKNGRLQGTIVKE